MTIVDRPDAHDELLLVELEPVRRALIADARSEAERRLAAARTDSEQMVAAANAEVDADVDRARRKAIASAEARADAQLTEARHRSRAAVLAARADLRRALDERVRARLAAVPDDPRYPRLLDHLTALARAQLGDDAVIVSDPDGGIVARSGSRRVDYRLAALVDRAIGAAAEEVASL